ncbi:MAG: hypothetical protein RL095_3058 [Verrucomicrobiota bacterium]|jgi:hypothetical protein
MKSLPAILLLLALPLAAEPLLVNSESVELENSQNRPVARLHRGELVDGEADPQSRDQVLLRRPDGSVLHAARRHFASREEHDASLRKQKIDAEAAFKTETGRSLRLAAECDGLEQALIETRRDACLSIRSLRTLRSPNGEILTVYDHDPLLSAAKARKFVKESAATLATQRKALAEADLRCEKAMAQVLVLDARLQALPELFSGRGAGRALVKTGAKLYLDNNKLGKVAEGEQILTVRPHPKHSDWRIAALDGKDYAVALADLVLLQGRRAEMDAGSARLAARLSALERRLADLKLGALLREAVARQLRLEKAIDGGYSELASLEVKIDESRKLSVRAPPAGLIYVHRREAEKLLEACAAEIKNADAETAKVEAEIAKARKQMIDFEIQAAKLEKLLGT